MAKRKHEPHEEHADETWLVPYSDLLTLLLALFIVLFASSQVSERKLAQMSQSFGAAFSSPFEAVPGGRLTIVQGGGSAQAPSPSPAEVENTQLTDAKKHMDGYVKTHKLSSDFEAVLTDQGLILRIRDTALFESGSAELREPSKQFAKKIADVLLDLPQGVIISGHTDNVPINTAEFPTNWDLSSKRALNFMKFLLTQEANLQPERFSAIGYGQYRPLDSNDTNPGRAKNRRVEVLILRNNR